MTIRLAKEKDGLYYLDTNWETAVFRSQGLVSTSSSKVNQIWLWLRCLGHPPFPLLKNVFPSLFKNFDYLDFHCEMCLLARYYRVSFLIKNPKCHSPFSLINSVV